MASGITGTVFNIQRYSVHDGEGIRTLVFLKGCPLRCDWCSNPESQRARPELARNPERCLGVETCDYCAAACPHGALGLPETGAPVVDRDLCQGCMACASRCPAQALKPYGTAQTVEAVLNVVERDQPFFFRSGGGMTLSGGEPLAQADFALALLEEARRRRIDCAVETCGHVPWPVLERAGQLVQEMFFDIKTADNAVHQRVTGVANTLILENFERLARNFPKLKLSVRTPVVPGVNDDEASIAAILALIAPFPSVTYELLPYHRMGEPKYRFLDRPFPMEGARPDDARFAALKRLAARIRPAAA